ncbi:MAG TPA: hypothetical protein IAB18_07215 [Candidatus Avisuccinivibrio pullicola]|nr:hypothetical protein [Candidatus Avisuccinivibrio pullicola]
MQYLWRVGLEGSEVWRLIALDGKSDVARAAFLTALSFGYTEGRYAFILNGQRVEAGERDRVEQLSQSAALDTLNLKSEDCFDFELTLPSGAVLRHGVRVLKAEEKLYCLIPSTLVGAHKIVDDGREQNLENINAYIEESSLDNTLNLRECTDRMRLVGSERRDLQDVFSLPVAHA